MVFPLPFRLVSRPSLLILLTQLYFLFRFALPCFAPKAVPQVLAFFSGFFRPLHSGIRIFLLAFFRPLTLPDLQLLRFLAFPFRFFLFPPRASFHSARSLLSSLTFSPSVSADFSSDPFGSAYLVLCLVSFRPSRSHSRSCSIGACQFPGFFRFPCFGIRPLLLLSFVRYCFRL